MPRLTGHHSVRAWLALIKLQGSNRNRQEKKNFEGKSLTCAYCLSNDLFFNQLLGQADGAALPSPSTCKPEPKLSGFQPRTVAPQCAGLSEFAEYLLVLRCYLFLLLITQQPDFLFQRFP
jgi:hypothetical protein